MSPNEVLAHKQALDLVRAAEYLGVSVQSVRRRIKSGDLPAHRVGPRSVRVYVDDLDKLRRPITSDAQLAQRAARIVASWADPSDEQLAQIASILRAGGAA